MSDTRLPVRSLLLALAVAGCSGRSPLSAIPSEATPVQATAEASLRVKARVEGPLPRLLPIDMAKDAGCASANPEPIYPETVVAKDGRLANVIAWVSKGLPDGYNGVPEGSKVVEIRGCMFRPHVLTLAVGQPLEIRNRDDVLHSHLAIYGRESRKFAIAATGSKDPVHSEALSEEDIGVRLKCNVHGWMEGWPGAFAHPFHGVTGEDGTVAWKVPPGTYEVSVWHEYRKFEKPPPRSVTVAAGERKDVEFVFRVP